MGKMKNKAALARVSVALVRYYAMMSKKMCLLKVQEKSRL